VISWRALPFDALTGRELYSVLVARSEVFVVEQNCVYLDPDGHDESSVHLLGEENGELAAYLRILPPGEKYSEASLGRVLTREKWRGTGLGRVLVAEGVRQCELLFSGAPIRIGAQAHLSGFYGEFGFEAISDPYDEDGIPHIDMLRPGAPL
jgi:ElaA protein